MTTAVTTTDGPPATLEELAARVNTLERERRRVERERCRLDPRWRIESPCDIVEGMAQLAAELESQPSWPQHLTVAETLHWPDRSSSLERERLLAHAGLSETRTVASLTAREVGVLCHALRSPSIWADRRCRIARAQLASGGSISADRGRELVAQHGDVCAAYWATHPGRGGHPDDFAAVMAYRLENDE